jgi:hypothetical protein
VAAAELKAGDSVAFTHPETGATQAATVEHVWRDNFSGARKVNVRLADGSRLVGLAHLPTSYPGHLHTPEAPKPAPQAAPAPAPVKRKEKASGNQG